MWIPPEVLKCITFIGVTGKAIEQLDPKATAFFVGYPLESMKRVAIYVVTARHSITSALEACGNAYLQLTKAGVKQWIKTDESQWVFHKDKRVDLAVLGMDALSVAPDDYDFLHVSIHDFLNNTTIERESIGPGDEVFFPGLFVFRNDDVFDRPIIRSGCIASMPLREIPTDLGDASYYLLEARSIGGMSGCPVFLKIGPIRYRKKDRLSHEMTHEFIGTTYHLLGVVHGHIDKRGTRVDREINTGIALATPVERLAEMLDYDTFVASRKAMRDRTQQG